ncbi:hint-domain-containing protein [Xylariaceae sp. FL0016]|nr:hint-domain-containing protein [Xylariaceae sp. FL0016]
MIHPLKSRDGVLVKVEPPVDPSFELSGEHVPCDIVLVIDVSGSMSDPAPPPANGNCEGKPVEDNGLSVLDLTKHAARTILETLNEGDRLGIVTFNHDAQVIQGLQHMTVENKRNALASIDRMRAWNTTNIWRGIREGVRLFSNKASDNGAVPALMVLTDGQPNILPENGHINKIMSLGPLPATIHTFGFGYDIDSCLLKSIAEVGGGNFAFIPDAGMIGTVFVHAVAHLQSTFAINCVLEITTPKSVRLETTAGKTMEDQNAEDGICNKVTIKLANMQCGQSRDIFLKMLPGAESGVKAIANAKLTYSLMRHPLHVITARNLSEPSELPDCIIAYHQSRSMICSFLSSFVELDRQKHEYKEVASCSMDEYNSKLQELLGNIPAARYNDELNTSLMEDLQGREPAGQISLAISRRDYFGRWGLHYYLSLWNAHAKQLCNSFKDPGPLKYNRFPPFIKCLEKLDDAFDDIPPPRPSRKPASGSDKKPPADMSDYNKVTNPCFASSSRVALESGHEVPIYKLRKGISIQTPAGARRVEIVLRTNVRGIAMCKVGDLLVTPWHPILSEDGGWKFPAQVTDEVVRYSGSIYSVLLQPDKNVEAHALRIQGSWGVTLGHGLTSGSDVRAHKFLGNYHAVARALKMLRPDRDGVVFSSGVKRSKHNGLVCGFTRPLKRSIS